MTLVISKGVTLRRTWKPMDLDAAAYIAAVEAADTAAGSPGGLEEKTKIAIDNFVLGCKADGTWSAIKASCILAGARTLSGCLVPLVGTAPTNANFVAGDYNRKTGLKGNAAENKRLSYSISTPSGGNHQGLYLTEAENSSDFRAGFMGVSDNLAILQQDFKVGSGMIFLRNPNSLTAGNAGRSGFYGCVVSDGFLTARADGAPVPGQISASQSTASTGYVFADRANGNRDVSARIAFFSAGTSLGLALLDARVTTLVNAIAAAIP
jgi:hypothetical protein